jgi:hypothetical protein
LSLKPTDRSRQIDITPPLKRGVLTVDILSRFTYN